MVQEIIVYIIGALLAIYLGYKLYRIFVRKRYDKLCSGCPVAGECGKINKERDKCDTNQNNKDHG